MSGTAYLDALLPLNQRRGVRTTHPTTRRSQRRPTRPQPCVAPILLLVRDAASDPEMARLQAELDEHRLTRMSHRRSRNTCDRRSRLPAVRQI
jgi:hypothetical protein